MSDWERFLDAHSEIFSIFRIHQKMADVGGSLALASASNRVIGLTLKNCFAKKSRCLRPPSENMSRWSFFSLGMSVRLSVGFFLFPATSLLSAQTLIGSGFVASSGSLNPFGANGALPFGENWEFGPTSGLKGGFSSGVGFNSAYDSNFFQTEKTPDSEVTLSLTPYLAYTTDPEGGANVMMTASYSPTGNWYLNNPDLNAFDQSCAFSMVVSGSRTVISLYGSFSQQSGVDRLAGGFLTGSALSAGLQASYQLAPRTNVYASFTPTIVDYETGGFAGFSDYATTVGGFWAATELLSIGPSVGYSTSSSDNTGDFDSWSLSSNVTYKASMRVQFAASLGLQYSRYSENPSSNGTNVIGSLNASYQINELWQWSNSIQSGATPSPSETNYVINNWSVTSMLNRNLVIGSVGMGLDLELSSYEQVGITSVSQEDEQNLGLILTYSRPIFSDRVGFNSSLRYVMNQGEENWHQIQFNLGLNYAF